LAELNSNSDGPAPDEIDMTWPDRCRRITGSTARVTFIGPTSRCQLVVDLCGVSSKQPP
jgi:hypothetical protein